jgi:DNA-binding NarL/FixJ family response regulator
MTTKVLVADDHSNLRHALRSVINQKGDWQVCAEATSGAEAVEQFKALHPDVAILDLVMGPMNGADAAEEIMHESPSAIVLTISLYDARPLLPRLQKMGVRGFVSKSRLSDDLIPAIEAALKGRTWFDPLVQ